MPLAAEARQFFLTGEPEIADRYFPWLVNLMSPAYWVYLAMAVTVLFNAMNGYSRFRLWRIDATREKLEKELEELAGAGLTHEQMRARAPELLPAGSPARETARRLLEQFLDLRARCQRQVGSVFVPMGDEIVLPISGIPDFPGGDDGLPADRLRPLIAVRLLQGQDAAHIAVLSHRAEAATLPKVKRWTPITVLCGSGAR